MTIRTLCKRCSVRLGIAALLTLGAVAFRKDNPKLREAVNDWIRKHQSSEASIPISGSTTSNASPRSGSGAKR